MVTGKEYIALLSKIKELKKQLSTTRSSFLDINDLIYKIPSKVNANDEVTFCKLCDGTVGCDTETPQQHFALHLEDGDFKGEVFVKLEEELNKK